VPYRLTVVDLTAEAATWAGVLDEAFPGDPIDRLLYATARDRRVPFVTKDEALRAFATTSGDVKVVWWCRDCFRRRGPYIITVGVIPSEGWNGHRFR
jgi:hypothetical protein